MNVPYVPGLEGVPVAKSAISFVDGEKGLLEYRGFDITDLAGHFTFEEIAFLLLKGRMPDAAELQAFSGQLRAARALHEPVARFIRELPRLSSDQLERVRSLMPRSSEEIRQEIAEEEFLKGN